MKELRKIVGNDIIIAIAGNKIDMEKNRSIEESEAVRLFFILHNFFQDYLKLKYFC